MGNIENTNIDKKKKLNIKKPAHKKIYNLQIDNLCNNNCFICKNMKSGYNKNINEIKNEIISKIQNGITKIILPCNTDRRNDFFDILKFLNTCNVSVELQSNGRIFYYKDFCTILTQYDIQKIVINLFGLTKKDYDTWTQTLGSFEQTLAGIENLLKSENFNLSFNLIKENGKKIYKAPLSEETIVETITSFKKRPNIFLVNPSYQPHWSKSEPTGLLYVASVLEENGYNVTFFDFNIKRYHFDFLKKAIEKKKPFAIGITCHVMNAMQGYHIGKDVKKQFPNIKIIYGGVHPTILPEDPFNMGAADFVAVNEAELTFLELLKNIDCSDRYDSIAGIAYRRGNRIITTKARVFVEDLDENPFPAYYLMSFHNYLPEFHIAEYCYLPVVHMITSRGCPYDCSYCSTPLLSNRRVRFRSIKNVVDEIEYLQKYFKIENIHFNDDNFMINSKRTLDLCKEIKKRKIKVRWIATSRVDIIVEHPEILRAMRRTGCLGIEIGVESGDQKVLDTFNKQVKLDDVKKANRLIKKNNIFPMYLMLSYGPGETVDSAYLSAKLIHELWLDRKISEIPVDGPETVNDTLSRYNQSLAGHIMRCSPGTKIYDNIDQYGYMFAKDWSEHHEQIIRFLPYSLLNDTPIKLRNWNKEKVQRRIKKYSSNIERYTNRWFYCSNELLKESNITIKDIMEFMPIVYKSVDGKTTVRQLYKVIYKEKPITLGCFISAVAFLSIIRLICSRKVLKYK